MTTTRPAPGRQPVMAAAEQYGSRGRALALARNLDLAVLVPGAGAALLLGAPVFGVLVGAGGWLLARAAGVVDRRLIARAAPPGSRLGLKFVDAFARVWLLAGAIIVAGAVGQRKDGLAAAVTVFAAYSAAFAVRIVRGSAAMEER